MKALYIGLAIGISILVNSCSIEDRLDRKADKLIGAWKIDKVIYDKYGSLFNKKVTGDYRNDEFEFLPDHQVYYYDDDIDYEFEGNWTLVAEQGYDHDGDEEFEFYIQINFYDPVLKDAFGYYGYISRLNHKKFTFHVADRSGELEFRFRRK